jgi:tRNA(fMet)-specific endonuclease VapC
MNEPAYLLDSNILIYLLDGTSQEARSRVEQCRPGEVVTSAIAFAEVMRKAPPDDARKRADVASVFRIVTVLPFDVDAAEAYRQVPFERHRFDHLIAAHALARRLVLVTCNDRHFREVPGLAVENWTLPR